MKNAEDKAKDVALTYKVKFESQKKEFEQNYEKAHDKNEYKILFQLEKDEKHALQDELSQMKQKLSQMSNKK